MHELEKFMPDDQSGQSELWDEYQWERFLQQQDQKTEQYFQLFEKYSDHPERDEIIAREMGWNVDFDADPGDATIIWSADDGEFDPVSFDEDADFDEDMDDDSEEECVLGSLENSEVYLQCMELNRRVFHIIEKNETLRSHPLGLELASRASTCSAKMAAALCGGDFSEIGMTIAYLKRSLKAANDCLAAVTKLRDAGLLVVSDSSSFTDVLFPIRERLVDMMREYRVELRRRRGE